MHRHLRHFAALALLALLLAAPGLALAHGEGPQQTVDEYTITLALPEKGFFTGRNPLAVSLWDWQGNSPEATLSVLLLAFAPAGDGHSYSHSEATPANDHAAADIHSEASAADDHGATEPEHAHDGASATEGQDLVVVPVALAASEELGEYRGELSFEQAGTYTLSVVFTIDGKERGAIFDVVVAQSRPRGLVLGGFALVNGLALATAAVLKYRTPGKSARKPARPATAPVAASPEEQP